MEGFLNPQDVLKHLKLKEDMVAADFGCGGGGWAIPLAKELEAGKVYAIDILEEPLSALRARMKLEKISNIETIQADVEKEVPLGSDYLDLVLMTNLLFECEDKKQVLLEGKRVLKSKGRILIVDWQKDNPLTKKIEKVDFEGIKKIARELNLKLEKEFTAGAYHRAIILVK